MKGQTCPMRPGVAVCALLALATVTQAKILSVSANGKGTYPTIRAALEAASSGDTILLEPGTYFNFGNQDLTVVDKALTVKGREPENPDTVTRTVIDCQGGGWSTHWAIGARSSGSAASARLTLAGLTIRNGYDVGNGCAVRCDHADLDVTNCVFQNNRTFDSLGGAVYCRDNSARFTGCTFLNNSSDLLHGGALYATRSQLDFTSCRFEANKGCALETYDCRLTLTACTFKSNQGRDGGALRCQGDTTPQTTSLTLTGCTFVSNTSSTCGGALYVYNTQTASISACSFRTNKATQEGGALYLCQSSPAVASCLFAGNQAGGQGGALHCLTGSSPGILNSTLVANTAAGGGAVAALGGSYPVLRHSILWSNTAPQGSNVYVGSWLWSPTKTAAVTVEFSDVQGGRNSIYNETGCPVTWDTAGNLDRDPLFTGAALADYHLCPDSPCINAGDPTYLPTSGQTDLDGNGRRLGPAVDVGAYEFHGLGPVYRFVAPQTNQHFYTIWGSERDALLRERPNYWQYEKVAFYAYYVATEKDLLPVYRFCMQTPLGYAYTVNEADRQKFLRQPTGVWSADGIAFFAYPAGRQPQGTLPVYQLWSNTLSSYFYTIDESEKNALLRANQGWQLDGIAWYACPDAHAP